MTDRPSTRRTTREVLSIWETINAAHLKMSETEAPDHRCR
jgi:hypothetical protein